MKEPIYPGRIRVLMVQVGGLFGPLAGGLVAPILDPIAETFSTSLATAAASVTAYMIPFAAMLVISGTLGERWGRRRVTQIAYMIYIGGLLLSAAAPFISLFLVGRAAQGFANAFTTPLLLAGLSEMVPRERRAGAIGVFASFQAAGQSLAAVVAALTTGIGWRWAFVAVAIVAAVVALGPPPGEPRRGSKAPDVRTLLSFSILRLCIAGFLIFFGIAGASFLVALYAQGNLQMSIADSGLLLTSFGIPGLILGRVFGGIVGRVGGARCGRLAALSAALIGVAIGTTNSVMILAILWALAGAAASMFNVALQDLTIDASPSNLGGGMSIVSACRFLGAAVAPTVWLPIFSANATVAFFGLAVVTALSAVALGGSGRHRQPVG